MKRNSSSRSKPVEPNRPFLRDAAAIAAIPGAQHSSSYFFPAVHACASCGGRADHHGLEEGPADEYDATLADEADRIAFHAKAEIRRGDPMQAAAMFRDAARLLDLWEARRRARQDAADAAKSKRRKAARS